MFPVTKQPTCCPIRARESDRFLPSETDLNALLVFLATFENNASPFTPQQTEALVNTRFSIPAGECPNVCSYSPLACSAVCVGCSLGWTSVMVGLASVGSKTALAFLGGVLAGAANGSGTCLTSIEASHRDNRQNVRGAIDEVYRSASNFLIENYIICPEEQKALWVGIARDILAKEKLIAKAISRHISPAGNIDVLSQAAEFVVSGKMPTDELLKNQIATFDSPTNAEHHRLVEGLDEALARINRLEEMVLHRRTEV